MTRQFTWVPADGSTELLLTDDDAGGYQLKAGGTRGLNAPPYRSTRSVYAGQDGTTYDAVFAEERPISLGLQISGATVAQFRDRWRALARAFRPKAGDGTLRMVDEWGQAREIRCRYLSGLEGDGEAYTSGVLGRAVVELIATDPWWVGDETTLGPVSLGVPANFFPVPPVAPSASSVQGQISVDLSDTDAPAFPVWTITGPGSNLSLTNVTTGHSLAIDIALTAGQQLIIDTRPRVKSVRLATGVNAMPKVRGYPDLWPLVESVNDLSVMMTGATAASRIVGVYRPRFAGV